MNRKVSIAMMVTMAMMAAIVVCQAVHPDEEYGYVHKYEPSYWQGFKNAIYDMNPFASKMGPDWQGTQYKVEEILRNTHLDAQRRVAELREDTLKDHKDLQQKIMDIYAQAAADAEKQIERLKRPLIASLWRSTEHEPEETESPTPSVTRGVADTVYDTMDRVKKKLTRHDQASMFDDAQKSIRDTYDQAIRKAKEGLSAAPSAGETLLEAKRRAQKAYDDMFHGGHATTRSTFQTLRDKLGYGMHHLGETATSAVVKTWHLLLHLLLGGFWMVLGVLAYGGIKWWMEKYTFKRQLASNVQGPVVLSKVFTVLGTEDTQRKFEEYWNGAAAGFFSRQAGVRKFSMQRGINIASNTWYHLSEWDSIEAVRKMMNNPELNELKKRMPKGVLSKRFLSQVVSTGKGMSAGSSTTGAGSTEGDIRASEGLRNRGPGTAHTVSS